MQRLKKLKQSILSCTESQVNGHLEQVDTKQLGEAVDMIKDLEQAMYYCTIVKAMQKQEEEEKKNGNVYYYTPMIRKPNQYWPDERYPDLYRDSDRRMGRMYYDDGRGSNNMPNPGRGGNMNTSIPNSGNNGSNNGINYYQHDPRYMDPNMKRQIEPYYPPYETHDYREGKSPMQRKMYMEGKETHKSKDNQMKQLEKYMQDLSKDITEMIQDASTEEKQMLQQKIVQLSKMII